MSLETIRAEIDRLDEQIVELLNRRTARAIEIGRIKEITASSVYVPAREKEVLDLILAGKMNKVVADKLGISMRTVEVHRAHILDKMQVKTAVELAGLLK